MQPTLFDLNDDRPASVETEYAQMPGRAPFSRTPMSADLARDLGTTSWVRAQRRVDEGRQLVHGLTLDPPTVTCDGCGRTATASSQGVPFNIVILTCGIVFNPRTYGRGDDRRLCRDCRRTEWGHTA
ncbi:hypothetical protein SCB71_14525 [Herbiconiux sp. KACC 21604]|uniref:hypothetical protein n=1 Tax=unclassified Herbiconiux TaxID=2618217 RepID=UPI001492F1BC|nr:hypothetical protein [Herbiconiux sp. SALV-R1]QJU54358.1 hypothetical protein HL652_12465 [Herbiconiux sp. SALV-R1]WPO85428.1 hypothetical protein SCB71_14525 [Herbiconiux sp. KACC 21604]